MTKPGTFKPMALIMAGAVGHTLVMAVVTEGDDDDVTIEFNGHVFSAKQLAAKSASLSTRQWALQQAIAWAAAHPELKATEADILSGAERFLEWLDKGKPTQKPSQMKPEEGGSEITFV